MISVDSNVLIALVSQNPTTSGPAMSAFEKATAIGPVYACGAVFSEMLGYPGRNRDDVQQFIATLGIILDWKMEKADWVAVGDAYRGYVVRRQASSGSLPRRIVTDFIIGAHASVRGYTLLTADRRLYNAAFPGLKMKSF